MPWQLTCAALMEKHGHDPVVHTTGYMERNPAPPPSGPQQAPGMANASSYMVRTCGTHVVSKQDSSLTQASRRLTPSLAAAAAYTYLVI